MKTVLITGANGQLGSELKLISSEYPNLKFLLTDVAELDITDLNKIKSFYLMQKFDFIINCAAYTNVDKAETDFEIAELINAIAVKNLAEVSSQFKIPLIHISTDYVFEGNQNFPYKETDQLNPQSTYGKTKLQGELLAQKAYKHIIIRTSWLYSSFGHNFVKTMLRLAKEKDEINVVADQIGSPTYAKDLAKAIVSIISQTIKNTKKFTEGIYHFSNEGTCSWYDFANEIMKQKEIKCKVKPVSTSEYPTPAKRPKYSLLDKTKIKETFNIEVRDWNVALAECLTLLD